MRRWTIRKRTAAVVSLVVGVALLAAFAVQAGHPAGSGGSGAAASATPGSSAEPGSSVHTGDRIGPGSSPSAGTGTAPGEDPSHGPSASSIAPEGPDKLQHPQSTKSTNPSPTPDSGPGKASAAPRATAPRTAAAAPHTAPSVLWGASWDGGPSSSAAWNRFESDAGKPVSMVMWFVGFDSSFPKQAASAAAQRGAVPLITWEPIAPAGKSAANYTFAAIARGVQDDYLSEWAAGARQLNTRIVIRLAPEMNGDWIPWAASKPGNSPKDFVAAWRHVVALFRQHGADRVEWAWVPNVPDPTSVPIATQYPGNDVVDWVGLDGYNWGTSQPDIGWQSFSQIFDAGLTQLERIAPAKPVILAETASTESGGSKAAWTTDFFASLKSRPQIKAVVWFNFDKETDWRIESSASAMQAFRVGIADGRYLSRSP